MYRSLVDKCLLQIGERAVGIGKSLERSYVLAIRPNGEVDAGVVRLTVDYYGARSALTYLTTLLDTRVLVFIAPKQICERQARVYIGLVISTV